MNIYSVHWNLRALQKWPPGATKPINLFEGQFQNDCIFYHSFSRSLYFFYMIQDSPSVYKISTVDDDSIPVNVLNTQGQGTHRNQLGQWCQGLYVTSSGDVLIYDASNNRVVKWMVNATSGIVIMLNGYNHLFTVGSRFFADEVNNAIYMVNSIPHFAVKYSSEYPYGMIVLGNGSSEISSSMAEYATPIRGVVDRMGNIIIAEVDKITKWTPDFKSRMIISPHHDTTSNALYTPQLIILDKFENLYIYDSINQQVVKFIRNSSTCTNDSSTI